MDVQLALWEDPPSGDIAGAPNFESSTQNRSAGRWSAALVAPAERTKVEVYTDGACAGNPGPGGWAWTTDEGRGEAGSDPHSTNQRMEIMAALQAVRAMHGPVVIVSDSTYVVNCFKNGWWRKWQRTGWLTSSRRPVANRDLWQPLVELVAARGDVEFRWIKGHDGHPLNERADQMAVAACRGKGEE